jgi:hypothetical protein
MVVNGAFQNFDANFPKADQGNGLGASTLSDRPEDRPDNRPDNRPDGRLAGGNMPMEFYLAQQQLYDDLLEAVRTLPPGEALAEFEAIFFGHSNTLDADVSPFLYKILFADNELEFRNTLKRACYIFVNNWDLSRQGDMLHSLLELFQQPSLSKTTLSPSLKRLRQWLLSFAASQDFDELQLFATQRMDSARLNQDWSTRYTAYQLIAQYINENNSLEQREAARTLSRRIKNKFKHDLAMYTAFSQSSSGINDKYLNPTVLGDEVLRLIKAILIRRGQYSYRNVARLFQQQTHGSLYGDYKESLIEYLCFSISDPAFLGLIETQLKKRLPSLYQEYDADTVDPSSNLRTCNRLIDYLTTEDENTPSLLFARMLAQGNPLNVVVILLKVVLVSPNSQLYLEARLANLIRYYKQFMEADCQAIIQFLEICGVTFAIYSDNVEYNLVQVSPTQTGSDSVPLGEFRIFSRSFRAAQKRAKKEFERRLVTRD